MGGRADPSRVARDMGRGNDRSSGLARRGAISSILYGLFIRPPPYKTSLLSAEMFWLCFSGGTLLCDLSLSLSFSLRNVHLDDTGASTA